MSVRVAAFALVLAACAPPEGAALESWRLNGEAVELPRNFMLDLPFARTPYTLASEVDVTPGQLYTLAIECFHGDLALVADGAVVRDDGDVGVGEHRFAIVPAGRKLALELVAQHDNESIIGFPVAPRLVRGFAPSHGPVAMFDRTVATVELGFTGLTAILFAMLFVLERRRESLAVAIGGVLATTLPLWQLGVVHAVFGRASGAVLVGALCSMQIAVLYFLHESFELGPPPRWMRNAFVAIAVGALLVGPWSFAATLAAMPCAAVCVILMMRHLIRAALRMRRERGSIAELRFIFIVMPMAALAMTPDIIGLASGKSLLGGAHTISFGVVAFVIVQALILARKHVARAQELRRQVAERSRELSEALAKLGGKPIAPEVDRVIDGRYRVVRKLGAGGMGAVYEVERTDGKRLALKTLRAHAPDAMARFAREAQIAAELDHPNLLPVLDVGIADGSLFLVMPLVAGGSLDAHRARFRDLAFAREKLAQIAAGLAALHERSIVHRDLKPGNILLDGDTIRIADFGLASLRVGGANDTATDDTAALDTALAATAPPTPVLTRAGDVFGTPHYMAPELDGGANSATAAADIFALGVIACELTTGGRPFTEPPIYQRLDGRTVTPPKLDGVDASLRATVEQCLDLDPARRPAASAVSRMLSSISSRATMRTP